MDYTLCRIIPKAPFHIGIKEGALEKTMHYIPSDTLFGAICNAYRLLYGKEELENLLKEFADSPPFLISSAFPYSIDINFFPMPKFINLSRYVERRDIKKFKKIVYMSRKVLDSLTQNNLKIHLKKENIIQGIFLVSDEEKNKLDEAGIETVWSEHEIPRVTIDRKTNSSNIYYFGEVEYNKNCGMYFLMDFINNGYKDKIKAAINLLGDEGIGGDRSYGKGLFRAEYGTFSWSINSGAFITMSLYLPEEGEIEMVKKGHYEIVRRGGWVYSVDEKGTRKKFIRMISEGSTFEGSRNFYGTMVKVAEGIHNVYRYGYAFPLYMGVLNEI